MDPELIDTEFRKYISKAGMYKRMRITHQHQKLLRRHLRLSVPISLEKKLRLLQLAGWRSNAYQYTREDLVSLARSILNASQSAQNMGPEYLVEKFLARPL